MPGPNSILRQFGAVAQVAPRALAVVRSKRRKLPVEPALTTSGVSDTPVLSSQSSTTTAIITLPSTVRPLGTTKCRRMRLNHVRSARETAKDVLLLSLDALSESSDVFPPLKSVVGGLRFFARQAELVSDNKEQIRGVYAQIDAFAASLVRAVPDVTALSPSHEAAICALAHDIKGVCTDMERLERQRLFQRFLLAKRHSAQLHGLARRLDFAHDTFTRTMLSSMYTTTTQILDCVQPLRVEVHRLYRWAIFFFYHSLFKAVAHVSAASSVKHL